MKPYGRDKIVSQNPKWKIDYHLHEKGRKLKNWWEEICSLLPRSTMKQNIKRNIDDELI